MVKKGGIKMKKLLIGMLITCSLGLVGCGKTTAENKIHQQTKIQAQE